MALKAVQVAVWSMVLCAGIATLSGCSTSRSGAAEYPWNLTLEEFDVFVSEMARRACRGNRGSIRDLVYAGLWTDTEYSNTWAEALSRARACDPATFDSVVEGEPYSVRTSVETALRGPD